MTDAAEVHMMIDLETMSLRPNAAVVQVGVVIFRPWEPLMENRGVFRLEWNVEPKSLSGFGPHFDLDTIMWWLGQSDTARHSIIGDSYSTKVDMTVVLDRIRELWTKYNCKYVWSQGAAFDVVVLEWYYAKTGRVPPWPYWAVRDTRTAYAVAEQKGWTREKRSTAHTAMADATVQAEDVSEALRWEPAPSPAYKVAPPDAASAVVVNPGGSSYPYVGLDLNMPAMVNGDTVSITGYTLDVGDTTVSLPSGDATITLEQAAGLITLTTKPDLFGGGLLPPLVAPRHQEAQVAEYLGRVSSVQESSWVAIDMDAAGAVSFGVDTWEGSQRDL